MDKIKNLGQVFTPDTIVDFMMSLKKNTGVTLEPSCGQGVFLPKLDNYTAIEIDKQFHGEGILNMDFFNYDIDNKFNTIIGNPPYVEFKNILPSTLDIIQTTEYLSSFDNRSNLYLHFIMKSLYHLEDGGEMIFITPRNFIKATSADNLNRMLFEQGTITDWYEYGDENIFGMYNPNVVVWRFEKDNFDRVTKTNNGLKNFHFHDGQISFVSKDYTIKFSDIFFVKVGAASGDDSVFIHQDGNREFVCSYTKSKGELKRMYYNVRNPYITSHKTELLKRKIKKFNESNWWQWGRNLYESNQERIYVNCKTRDMKPFFTHESKDYDGAILGIFPKYEIDIDKARQMLNKVDWDDLGFKIGGRLFFSQKALENCYLPEEFSTFRNNTPIFS